MNRWILLAGGMFMLSACTQENENGTTTNGEDDGMTQETAPDTTMDMTTLADQLEAPWTIVKGEDAFFVPRRDGTIYVITDNGTVSEQPVYLEEDVEQEAESGLLGMVLHPEFEENQAAFLYHSYESNGGIENRIVETRWDEENEEWNEVDVLLDGIPGAGIHNGGRLAIGPDQLLYATTGDADQEELAQDVDNLAGSILRMEFDGAIPSDNPFENSVVYSYGHRNPQGLAWLEDGTMFSSEHGPVGHDEMNVIEPGSNYGWPEITGDETRDGMMPPLIHSGEDTWAPSGLTADEDQLFVAGLRGEAIYQIAPDDENLVELIDGVGRIRDVHVEDGVLYFITNNTDGRGSPSEEDDQLIKWELN